MSLLSRYVAAVKRHLKSDRREDIGRELESSLADELDALESACGQPLDDAQIAEVLRRRGHPLQVAASFQNRALISPCTFPLYVNVLRAGLTLVISMVVVQLLLGSDRAASLTVWKGLLHDAYWAALWLFSWTTVAFFFLDSWILRGNFFRRWDPLRLRPAELGQLPIGVGTAIAETVFNVLLLSFVSAGASIGGRWLNADGVVYAKLVDSVWLVPAQIALVLALGIGLLGFLERYWTRAKLIPFAAAHLLLGVVLAAWAAQSGSIAITGAKLSADHAVQDSLRFLLLLAALRSLFAAAQAISRFRRLSWMNERPLAR